MARRYWLAFALLRRSVARRRVHAEDADHAGQGDRGARRNRGDLRELSRGRRVGDAERALPRVPHRRAHRRLGRRRVSRPASRRQRRRLLHLPRRARRPRRGHRRARHATRSRTSTPTSRCSVRTSEVACAGCHAEGTEFRAAPRTCIGCHAGRRRARRRARADVRGLSQQRRRGAARRSITARAFALAGKHAATPCAGCHENQSFAATPKECAACHRADDVHARPQRRAMRQLPQRRRLERGELRSRRRQRLRAARQPPALDLRVVPRDEPRRGAAVDVRGLSSQRRPASRRARPEVRGLPQRGAVGRDELRSLARQRFRARRRAREVECTSCHTAGRRSRSRARVHVVPRRRTRTRPSRRALRPVPLAAAWLRRCASITISSRSRCSASTRRSQCVDCHASLAFHDAGANCADCHAAQDAHDGAFGAACGTCHNPRDWRAVSFDHAAQTGFALTGAHARADVLDLPRQRAVSPPRARRRAASATAKTTRMAAASAPTARAATAPIRSARFAGGEADAGETRYSQRPHSRCSRR